MAEQGTRQSPGGQVRREDRPGSLVTLILRLLQARTWMEPAGHPGACIFGKFPDKII